MKKKILSLTLACLMIMTAFVTIVPTASAATVTGAPTPSLTADEQALANEGYVAYVTHTSITSATEGAVEIDGTYAKAFQWLTPGDTTKAKFDAFFALPYADRDAAEDSANYVEYAHTNGSTAYLNDTAWGYVTALDGATVVFLNNVYSIGPGENIRSSNAPNDKSDVIEHGGTIGIQRDRTIDGNGFSLYMEGPICTGNNVKITVNWKNINIQANSNGNAVIFRARSASGQTGQLNFENCTFSVGTIDKGSATNIGLFYADTHTVQVSLTNCKIDFDSNVLDNHASDFAVFHAQRGGRNGDTIFKLTDCEIDLKTSSTKSWIFKDGNKGANAKIDLTNVKVDTTTSAPNANFIGVYKDRNTIIDVTDCDIKVGGCVFSGASKGAITIDGTTSIVAPTLITKNGSTTPTVIATNPNFYTTSEGGAAVYAAPEMVDGASVRTNTDSNGLRFTANFAKENTATSYGMLVTLASNLTNTAFTAAALEAAGVKTYAAVPANIVADDGSFTTALLGIADVNAQYAARGYAIYETENATITVYSAYNADKNCRSLAWVADAATKDVKTEKNQTTGHIFEVETGVFSRYSKDQYEVVKAYAAQYNG